MSGQRSYARAGWRLGAACFLALALGSFAAVPGRAQQSTMTGVNSVAVEPIQYLNQSLLAIMKAGTATPFRQRYAMLAPAVQRALDLSAILRLAVGASWFSLSAQDRQTLLQAFTQYTIATYVKNFNSYNGQQITISPQTRSFGNGVIVQTRIIPRSGEEHRIDYVMRQSAGGAWKATDVLADGTISRVAVLRSDFQEPLQQGGASALVASLQRKTASLEAG